MDNLTHISRKFLDMQTSDGKKRKRRSSASHGASAFSRVKVKVQSALLPSCINDVIGAVEQSLNSRLCLYQDRLQGVPLAYTDVEFPEGYEHGRIIEENPHIHFDTTATVLVFQPQINMHLTGKVSKITSTHISLLVFGIFNAAIQDEHLMPEFQYDKESNQWSGDREIKEGDELAFYVQQIQHNNGILDMKGSLLPVSP